MFHHRSDSHDRSWSQNRPLNHQLRHWDQHLDSKTLHWSGDRDLKLHSNGRLGSEVLHLNECLSLGLFTRSDVQIQSLLGLCVIWLAVCIQRFFI